MYRDYTDAMLEKLKKQIQEINDSDFCFLTDAIGDLYYTASDWLGFLDIERYVNDVDTYHRKVMDQHNTTLADLDRIFNAVKDVDTNYAAKLGDILSSFSSYVMYMRQMTELIDPSATRFNAETIKTTLGALSQEIADASTQLDGIYEESLRKRELQLAKESFLDLISNLLAVPVHICKFIGHVAEGDFASAAADGWGIINDVFLVGEDLCALAIIPIGYGLSKVFGNNNMRLSALDEAEDMSQRDGLSSELEAVGAPTWLVTGTKIADAAAEIKGLTNTAKGFVEDVGDFFTGELSGADFFLKEIGVGDASKPGGTMKTLKTIYDATKARTEGQSPIGEIFGDISLPKIARKTRDVTEDLFDLAEPWIFGPAGHYA